MLTGNGDRDIVVRAYIVGVKMSHKMDPEKVVEFHFNSWERKSNIQCGKVVP